MPLVSESNGGGVFLGGKLFDVYKSNNSTPSPETTCEVLKINMTRPRPSPALFSFAFNLYGLLQLQFTLNPFLY